MSDEFIEAGISPNWWVKPPRFSFEPEPDITAYEVAFVLRAVLLIIDLEIFDRLPVEVARHFKPVKNG